MSNKFCGLADLFYFRIVRRVRLLSLVGVGVGVGGSHHTGMLTTVMDLYI